VIGNKEAAQGEVNGPLRGIQVILEEETTPGQPCKCMKGKGLREEHPGSC
jgi:hypothetical protein